MEPTFYPDPHWREIAAVAELARARIKEPETAEEFFDRIEGARGSLVEIDAALSVARRALDTKTPFVWRGARAAWFARIEEDRLVLLEARKVRKRSPEKPLTPKLREVCQRLTSFCEKVLALDDPLDRPTRLRLIEQLCLERGQINAKEVAFTLGISLRSAERDLAEMRKRGDCGVPLPPV
jgi:hypothetical protein